MFKRRKRKVAGGLGHRNETAIGVKACQGGKGK